MKVNLIREKRKTMVLTLIDEENAVLKVPKNLSDKKVSEFLESKQKWLTDKAKKLKENKEFSKRFELKDWFYHFGEKSASFHDVILGFDKLTAKQRAFQIRKFYLSHFSNLEEIAYELSSKTGFSFDKIKPIDSVRVWGSYSAVRVMKLNWKLLLLPRPLVEYVIIHELCHSKHMNHKPQFWKEVERFCPDYKQRRKAMGEYAFLLKAEL